MSIGFIFKIDHFCIQVLFSLLSPSMSAGKFKTSKNLCLKLSLYKLNFVLANLTQLRQNWLQVKKDKNYTWLN